MFRQQLEAAIVGIRDRYEDDKRLSAAEVLHIVADFADVLSSILRSIVGDDSKFNQLVDDTEWVYEKYIVPFDFPVNNVIEKWMESQGKLLIRPLLESLKESIK